MSEIELLQAWQLAAGELCYSRKMATKSAVGDLLIARLGIDRAAAHDICNAAQAYNVRPFHAEKIGVGGIWASQLITEITK